MILGVGRSRSFAFLFSICTLVSSLASVAPASGSAAQITYMKQQPVREAALASELIEWRPFASPEFYKKPLGPCSPHQLRDRLASQSATEAPQRAKQEIEACLPKWQTSSSLLGDLIQFSGLDYRYDQNRSLQYLRITLQNGKVLRGVLGMKDDPRPRPLVIAACGVMCEAGDRTSTYLMMQLFDETPFHVLVLGNHTSKDFVEDNHIGGLGGGINAGDSLVKLAQDLRSSQNPLSKKISHVFLYGLSLGGHEALYASYLHQRMVQMGGQPVIDGVALNSPVVDYPATIQRLSTKPVIRKIFQGAMLGLFKLVSALIGFDLDTASKQITDSNGGFKVNVDLFYANQTAYQKKFPSTEPWEVPAFQNPEDLLEFARFQNLAADTQIPTLAFASLNDPVVRPSVNSKALQREDLRDRYGIVLAEKGSHMAAVLAYGWRNISLAFQGFYLALAPEFTQQLRAYSVSLPDLTDWNARKIIRRKQARIVATDWHAHMGSSKVDLQLVVTGLSSSEPPSCKIDPASNPGACTSSFGIPLDLQSFPTKIAIPNTKGEQDALTRWLNVQMDIVDKDGQNPVDSQNMPTRVKYREL